MKEPQSAFRRDTQQRAILLWTDSYRMAVCAALMILAGLIGNWVYVFRQAPYTGNPERINPNTASVASLVRLPGIGKARAMDIIHFRQATAVDGTVFNAPSDMQQIRGIGPKTAEKISPWLTFKDDRTTQ